MTVARATDRYVADHDRQQCIIAEAAAAFDVTADDILGVRRTRRIALARHVAVMVLRSAFPDTSYATISGMVGRKHESATAMHGIARIARMRKTDQALDAVIETLLSRHPARPVRYLPCCETVPRYGGAERLCTVVERQAAARTARLAQPCNKLPPAPPSMTTLGLPMQGVTGDPGLTDAEISERVAQVVRDRRARELAMLDAERRRYGLARRGRAMSEMVA